MKTIKQTIDELDKKYPSAKIEVYGARYGRLSWWPDDMLVYSMIVASDVIELFVVAKKSTEYWDEIKILKDMRTITIKGKRVVVAEHPIQFFSEDNWQEYNYDTEKMARGKFDSFGKGI